MEKDYIEFMSKMLDKGHAVLVLTERYPAINPLDEYGTCLTSTCII